MAERLSGLDVTYLTFDGGPMPMNTGGLVVLGPGPHGETLTARPLTELIADRLHLLPRYRQVVRPAPSGLIWTDDRGFELMRHVRHHRLPAPGGAAELAGLAGTLHATALDPRRPLWEAHAIEGLAGGRSALLMRWQHAMVDGMSGIEVARVLFDAKPDVPAKGPQPWAPADPQPMDELIAEAITAREATRLANASEAITDLVDPMRALDRATGFLDGWIAQLEATRGDRWFRESSDSVRYGLATISDSPLRGVARTLGVGMDHIALTLAAGGVADLLEARGDGGPHEVIRTVVPVAVPKRSRREVLGNSASYYIAPLPVSPMRPLDRLRAVVDTVSEIETRAQVATISTMLEGLDRLPPWVVATAAKAVSGSGSVDLVVSYVRGARRPLWMAGLPHVVTHPLLPVGPFVRLMIGAVSLGGALGLGVTADQAAVPELDYLLHRIEHTAEDLVRAVG